MQQKILELIQEELKRQNEGMELIPSENYVSQDVRTALGSILTNKYSEGYPGARYYGGQEIIDQIETEAIELCKKVFGVGFANVQPYSGSPANAAVYLALLQPGETFMGMELAQGGHLTHGFKNALPGKIFNPVLYGVGQDGFLDYDAIQKMAEECKPKLIVAGATSYPRIFDFKKFSEIAKSVGAYLFVDMAHFAGLVAGGAHPSPFPYADVASFTTHKTMRGPRGGTIVTNDAEIAIKVNKAVFPGLQGGPHDNNTAAKGICFAEALQPEFKTYAHNVVKNSKLLAERLHDGGLKVITDGTDNHLMVLDVTPLNITGKQAQELLDSIGITLNKQLIPHDTRKPSDPSGVRLGSPAMTTRGFAEREFIQTADWIIKTLKNPEDTALHQKIRQEVKELCLKHPVPYKQ